MSDLPAPPAIRLKSPSWLDGRLVVGVVLVLLSVLVGAKIIASSDHYDTIWAASRDLAPGTTLVKADLLLVNVRFKDHGGVYISAAGPSPVGRTTSAPLTSGQLIPLAALPSTKPVPVRLVTIPVAKLHMPSGNDLHGVQVDLVDRDAADGKGFGGAVGTLQRAIGQEGSRGLPERRRHRCSGAEDPLQGRQLRARGEAVIPDFLPESR